MNARQVQHAFALGAEGVQVLLLLSQQKNVMLLLPTNRLM